VGRPDRGRGRRALGLAGTVDDATKAALVLCDTARRFHVEPLGLYAGARYRLAGILDRDPTDLVALAGPRLRGRARATPPGHIACHHPVDD
jgi:hypothetical protein